MEPVGVIGVGNIGRHLVSRLIEAGYEVWAHDLREEARKAAEDLGARAAADAAEVGSRCALVMLSLPLVEDVRRVLLGPTGLLTAMASGGLVVDLSTGHPAAARELAAAARERGLGFIDAPVSWGEGGLNVMVGGGDADVERAMPALQAVSGKVTHVGPLGCGQVAKLVNQMIMAATWAAIGESFAFARRAGAHPERVLEAIRTAGAASRLLDGAVRALVSRDFGAGGTLALHEKDLWYAQQTARQVGAGVPLTAFVREVFQSVHSAGDPDWGQTAVATFWESLGGLSPGDPAP